MTPGTETADREQLGDFYLYPIAERTTIANTQTKQVSFLDVQGVPARKIYGRTVDWLSSDAQPVNVQSQIAFSSSREGGLGDALPAGTVRFYQRDKAGNPQFIGENGIGHTPMGSELTLSTGDAFDVFVQAEVEKRDRITADEWETYKRYQVFKDGELVAQTPGAIRGHLLAHDDALHADQREAGAGRRRADPGRARPRLVVARLPGGERGRAGRAAQCRPPQVRDRRCRPTASARSASLTPRGTEEGGAAGARRSSSPPCCWG